MSDEDYKVVSVEPADPRDDMVGKGWHCYIIERGDNNTIRGYRRGSVRAVTRAAEEIVARLNERRYKKSGRVHLNLTRPTNKARPH